MVPFSMVEQVVGRSLDAISIDRLKAFVDWLGSEGLQAGGIGPQETERLWDRHIADAAAFSVWWSEPPETCLDLGSGVGLPGIVLAILWPGTRMLLVDRSGRRVRLMRRAVRVLGLDNVEVQQLEADALLSGYQAMVMRAVFPPGEAVAVFDRLLAPGGQGVLGLSRNVEPNDLELAAIAGNLDVATRVGSVEVLDQPAWMLIMCKS